MSEQRSMVVDANTRNRVIAFLEEFKRLPNDGDIEIRIGSIIGEDHVSIPAIVVSLNGKDHGFSVADARKLADVAEGVMNLFKDDPRSNEFPNLIMMLRLGADRAVEAMDRAAP